MDLSLTALSAVVRRTVKLDAWFPVSHRSDIPLPCQVSATSWLKVVLAVKKRSIILSHGPWAVRRRSEQRASQTDGKQRAHLNLPCMNDPGPSQIAEAQLQDEVEAQVCLLLVLGVPQTGLV